MGSFDYAAHNLPNLNCSVSSLVEIFKQLEAPNKAHTSGFYRVHYIGPFFIRMSGKPSMDMMRLPNWQGKRFIDDTKAINVLLRNGNTVEVFPMINSTGDSVIDGKPCKLLTYDATTPIPWRWARDEFRQLNDYCLLGITTFRLPLIQFIKFPFLLVRDSNV